MRLLAVMVVGAAACSACRDGPTSGAAAGVALTAGSTPEEVAERIHELRVARRYSELSRLVVSERAAETTAMLLVVDQILDANRRVQALADQRLGAGVAIPWDMGAIRDNLGLLSLSVRAIRVETAGERATVVVQEGANVPLVYERFERREGAWLYSPEPLAAGIVDDLNRLGRAVSDIADGLAAGTVEVEQMDHSFRYRVLPIMKAIEGRGARRAGGDKAKPEAASGR